MDGWKDGWNDGGGGWMDRWIDRALKVQITKEKFKNENLEGSLTLLKIQLYKLWKENIVCIVNIIAQRQLCSMQLC